MSTTPMQRPFLVGHRLAARDTANENGPRRESTHHGLHLVPAPAMSKIGLGKRFSKTGKITAIVATLFLVLTVV